MQNKKGPRKRALWDATGDRTRRFPMPCTGNSLGTTAEIRPEPNNSSCDIHIGEGETVTFRGL